MSVVKFAELHSARKSSHSADDNGPIVTYERAFRVVTDDKTDRESVIFAHGSCPALGAAHPDNSGALCLRREPRQQSDSPLHWIVTCSYSTRYGNVETDDDPTVWAAEVDYDDQELQVPLITDVDTGKAIVNTAGDPPNPPLMTRRSATVINILKRVTSVPAYLFDYRFTRNASPITIEGQTIAAGRAAITSIRLGRIQKHKTTAFRELSIRLEIARTTHKIDVLNAGYYQLRDGNQKLKEQCLLSNGEPVQSPVPLDASGRQIAAADLPDAAVVNSWNQYPAVDFTPLGLPA